MKRTLEILMLGACIGFFAVAAPQNTGDNAGKMDSHKMDTKKMSGKMDGQKMKQKKTNSKMQKNESDEKKKQS